MKKEEDKWINSFRDRMKGYTEPVSPDVWASLEKELQGPFRKGRHSYRWLGAAAAVLLAVISSFSLYFLHTPSAGLVRETSVQLPVLEPSPSVTSVMPESLPALITQACLTGKKKVSGESREEYKNELQTIRVETELSEKTLPAEKKVEEKVRRQTNTKHSSAYEKSDYGNIVSDNHRKHAGWSVGISAGNLTTSSQNSHGFGNLEGGAWRNSDPYAVSDLFEGKDGASPVNSAAREAYKQILLNHMNKEVKTEIKHKMPVTFGVSARVGVSSRFAVETGLNYTLLSSDLKSGDEAYYYQKEQKLHYLGIPIKGSWLFLQKKYLTLYFSAGGMMEVCVAGKLKTNYVTDRERKIEESEDIRVKPLQWSVASAVGAQFNASRYIGIYVEPGIVYYFDDGSSVQTIRKDKPFNFNLQLGVRFTY